MPEQQLGLDLGDARRSSPDRPLFDPDQVRGDALALLATARACTRDGPWDADELRYRRIMFPHLVSWLPDPAERAQLCFDFAREIDRIALLQAA